MDADSRQKGGSTTMHTDFGRSIWSSIVCFGLLAVAKSGFSTPQAEEGQTIRTLTVKIVGARNAKGRVGVALFQAARGFPTNASAALRTQQSAIDSRTMTAEVVFRDVPPGVYAVAVFHDENVNG